MIFPIGAFVMLLQTNKLNPNGGVRNPMETVATKNLIVKTSQDAKSRPGNHSEAALNIGRNAGTIDKLRLFGHKRNRTLSINERVRLCRRAEPRYFSLWSMLSTVLEHQFCLPAGVGIPSAVSRFATAKVVIPDMNRS